MEVLLLFSDYFSWSYFIHKSVKFCGNRSSVIDNIWKESHISSALDSSSKLFLHLERYTRIVSWNDLIEFCEVLFQSSGIFVVDRRDTFCLEWTLFLLTKRHKGENYNLSESRSLKSPYSPASTSGIISRSASSRFERKIRLEMITSVF